MKISIPYSDEQAFSNTQINRDVPVIVQMPVAGDTVVRVRYRTNDTAIGEGHEFVWGVRSNIAQEIIGWSLTSADSEFVASMQGPLIIDGNNATYDRTFKPGVQVHITTGKILAPQVMSLFAGLIMAIEAELDNHQDFT